jgi:3-hydroxy-9,10-secoandrosta-1,3,5(10)-triene-9,17-dione monooxygenase reductase component
MTPQPYGSLLKKIIITPVLFDAVEGSVMPSFRRVHVSPPAERGGPDRASAAVADVPAVGALPGIRDRSAEALFRGDYATAPGGLPGIDPRVFRNVLGRFCTGVTVITALEQDGAPAGFACQSFAALSLEPPLVLFCPAKGSRTWAAIERAGKFCVNILTEEQRQVCARFGSRTVDRFAGTQWYTSELDLPVLVDGLAAIQCSVASVVDGGDHLIVVGRVLALSEPAGSGRPLLFYRGRYAGIAQTEGLPPIWHADLEHFLTATSDSW